MKKCMFICLILFIIGCTEQGPDPVDRIANGERVEVEWKMPFKNQGVEFLAVFNDEDPNGNFIKLRMSGWNKAEKFEEWVLFEVVKQAVDELGILRIETIRTQLTKDGEMTKVKFKDENFWMVTSDSIIHTNSNSREVYKSLSWKRTE